MANWYFSAGGKAEGPVDESNVLEALKAERLNLVDLVFEEGSAAWLTIGEVPQFREAFHEFKRLQIEEAERRAAAELAKLNKEAALRAEAAARESAKVAARTQALAPTGMPAPSFANAGSVDAGSSGAADPATERKRAQQAKLQAAIAQTAKISKSIQPQSIAALSAADEWVILRKTGEQYEQIGPFTREFVLAKLGTGEIEYSQYAWKPGFQRWVRIGNLPEFDRRRPERDADDLARIIAKVPTPTWEQDAIRTPSPSFEDVQSSVLEFDSPLDQIRKTAARELPPEDAAGDDLLGSVTSPGMKQIGQRDSDAEELQDFSFHEELTPIPDELQTSAKRANASSRPENVASKLSQLKTAKSDAMIEEAVSFESADQANHRAHDLASDRPGDRPFDELTQPSFQAVEDDFSDEKTGDFSNYLGTKPLLDHKSGGPPETISRRPAAATGSNATRSNASAAAGPPPVKKNSKLSHDETSSPPFSAGSSESAAPAEPPHLLEDLEKTRIESSYSQSISGITSPTLVREQAALLSSETVVGLIATGSSLRSETVESKRDFEGKHDSSIKPESSSLPGLDYLSGLVRLQPAKEAMASARELPPHITGNVDSPANHLNQETDGIREISLVAGSLREALKKANSISPSEGPKPESANPRASLFDDQATVVGSLSARTVPSSDVKVSPDSPSTKSTDLMTTSNSKASASAGAAHKRSEKKSDASAAESSVFAELSDGRTIVQSMSSRQVSNKSAKGAPPNAPVDQLVPSQAQALEDESSEERMGERPVGRGIRKRRRKEPASRFVQVARLFIAGLVLGVLGLYGFHVYTTHQFGLAPHLAGSSEEDVQGPPDIANPDSKGQKEAAPTSQSARPSGASPSAMMPPPPPPVNNTNLPARPPSNEVTSAGPTSSTMAQPDGLATPQAPLDKSKVVTKANDEADDDDSRDIPEATKAAKSALALSNISGVRAMGPGVKATSLEILPYRLTTETPLLLLQTNAPVGERLMVRIRGRSGEILKYRSYIKILKVVRNANEFPGFDLSKLKLPTGSYKVEAAVGELKKTTQVFLGSRDTKYGQELEHHLKEISFEQQREKKSMFYAAKSFETLALSLNENFDKLHAQSGAWRTFLRAWNRQVSSARSPISQILGDRRNYPMAYPDEVQGLFKMVSQLSAQAKELDIAVQQKRDVASQSAADLAKEFTRIKQEIAMISSRRAP